MSADSALNIPKSPESTRNPPTRRRIFVRPAWTLIFIICFFFLPEFIRAERVSTWEWEGVSRVVAIGDIHGSSDKLLQLLQGTGLVNEELSWTGGQAHLVMCGDLVHRGPGDRAVLDLIIRLQGEAEAKGGRVHVTLGNHEVLTLVRDLRYVHEKSYADYLPEEKEEDRKKAWEWFKEARSEKGLSEAELLAAFEETYPAGFFGRLLAFAPQGQYGEWLLARPAVIKINGIVFVHGGLTKETAAGGLTDINGGVQSSLTRFIENREVIEPLVQGPATFEKTYEVVAAILKGTYPGRINRKAADAAKALVDLLDSPILSSEGPLWYRGNSLENEQVERATQVVPVLDGLKAKTLVVGHTPTGGGRITSRFNERLYRTDVGMVYGRNPFCLIFEGDKVATFNPATRTLEPPVPENPQGQEWSRIEEQLSDQQMESFLRTAEVKGVKEVTIRDRTISLVELKGKGLHLRAIFGAGEEKAPRGQKETDVRLRSYKHELAAYWLDRKMGFHLVPVAVSRNVGGKSGVLEIWLEAAVDKPWIEEQRMIERIVEELKEEVNKAWVFSALIDVEPRLDEAIMVIPEERRVVLSGNSKSFSHFPEIQKRFLPYVRGLRDPALELALRSLDGEELSAGLKDLLSDGQIRALLQRRDRILELMDQEEK